MEKVSNCHLGCNFLHYAFTWYHLACANNKSLQSIKNPLNQCKTNLPYNTIWSQHPLYCQLSTPQNRTKADTWMTSTCTDQHDGVCPHPWKHYLALKSQIEPKIPRSSLSWGNSNVLVVSTKLLLQLQSIFYFYTLKNAKVATEITMV